MRTTILVLAVVCLAPLRGWCQANAEQSRILSLENAWNEAVQQKNTAAIQTLLDSGLVYVDYDGKLMDKAEYLASVKSESLHPHGLSANPCRYISIVRLPWLAVCIAKMA